jgi:hypothetical protein
MALERADRPLRMQVVFECDEHVLGGLVPAERAEPAAPERSREGGRARSRPL